MYDSPASRSLLRTKCIIIMAVINLSVHSWEETPIGKFNPNTHPHTQGLFYLVNGPRTTALHFAALPLLIVTAPLTGVITSRPLCPTVLSGTGRLKARFVCYSLVINSWYSIRQFRGNAGESLSLSVFNGIQILITICITINFYIPTPAVAGVLPMWAGWPVSAQCGMKILFWRPFNSLTRTGKYTNWSRGVDFAYSAVLLTY